MSTHTRTKPGTGVYFLSSLWFNTAVRIFLKFICKEVSHLVEKDTIVVVGKVRPSKYQQQRAELLEAGVKPVIFRVSNKLFPVRYCPATNTKVADYMTILTEHYFNLDHEPAPNTVFNLIALDILEENPDLDFSKIAKVVYSKESHRAWKEVEYGKVFFGRASHRGLVISV